METFLSNTLQDVIQQYKTLDHICFVLPNQRAGVYLKKHIKQSLNKATFFPEIITFDKLSEQITGVEKTPSIVLLFDFYTIYKKLTPPNRLESFEQFSNWATTVLNDFNEIDGYLVEPKEIFNTLKSINTIHNWNPNTRLTQNYLIFLQNLEIYYGNFYKFLKDNQKGYQGLILKEAVASLQHFILHSNTQFVFIGFNHLKKSESFIIEELLVANRAHVYWDIPDDFLNQKSNSRSFIHDYITKWAHYKNSIHKCKTSHKFNPDKIEIVGVSKNVGMLKHASKIIKNDSKQIALILADQTILPITLNSIPETIDKINITMGLPLKHFSFANLIKSIFELHVQNLNSSDKKGYYHKTVLAVLQHPLLRKHTNSIENLTENLIINNKVYLSYDNLKKLSKVTEEDDKLLQIIFTTITQDPVKELLDKIDSIILFFKTKVQGIEREILYKHFQLNQQLQELSKKYNYLKTGKELDKVYTKLLHSENVNYFGEPLQGLQIMGLLETQALDFKNIIITSVNEGILPKGKHINSFIPFDVRKHYSMFTYQDEDAIFKYHFFRLLQRAEKVNLLYNLDTDTFGGGEKSHFLSQLLWEYPNISQKISNPKVPSDPIKISSIKKSSAVIEALKKLAIKGFSPSALSTYLYNPLEFYQQKVLKIYEVDEIEETIADNTMGTVIHETLYRLYLPFKNSVLNEESLQKLIPEIPKQVEQEFKEVYKNGQFKEGKNRLIYEVIINFVRRFIKDEIKTIKNGEIIRILALEVPLSQEISFPNFDFPIHFKGIVDRIDEVDGVIRIIDYKSGKVASSQLRLNDFSRITTDYKYSKGLQVMLYAYLYTQQESYDNSKELQAGIISFKNLKNGFLPVNFASGHKKDYTINENRINEFLESLEILLLEIFDESVPFEEII